MGNAYKLIRQEMIEDVHAKGTLLEHKKTGARIVLLENDDENKVFNIAFRTPPRNSSGVAHIIEHTVLCGSAKYPLKDPFVELAKGSLNTFLNAMTYPDKTMYPVASCNDTDFQNLVDVYLDAVFHPNIYYNEKIFRQEGWHYHLENTEDPLTLNGVVYNEMKGAFSNAEDVLEHTVFSLLFPDTPYGVESGGDPDVIPELTYEEFLDFHRAYYHPSNSYIYFYGNMDMEEKLDWLDREYLSTFERRDVPSVIPMQAPFEEMREYTGEYPILDDDPEEENTYLSRAVVVSGSSDVQKNIAFSILEYVLLDAPGAPLKEALLDAGIGKSVTGGFSSGILQPFFEITARNAEAGDKERFLQVIDKTLRELADGGLNHKAIASGLNYFEFRFREAESGSFSKGLFYGLDLFDSWLYDDSEPFAYIRQLGIYADLKQKAEEGYFEQLIRECLLDNPHGAVVVLKPRRGLAAVKEEETARKLEEQKAALSREDLERIVRETAELKAYQEEEDTPETLAKLPLLSRSDIDRKSPYQYSAEESRTGGALILKHHFFTNGIGYLRLLFDTEKVPDDLVPYLGLLGRVLGMVSTEHYSYGDLFHEINGNSGGINFSVLPMSADRKNGREETRFFFYVQASYLYPKETFVFDMIREILRSSKMDEYKRIRELLAKVKAGLQQSIPSGGHASAIVRASSDHSRYYAWNEATNGIRFYHFLKDLEENFDERKEEFTGKLTELMKIVFRPENMIVSLTAGEDGFGSIEANTEALLGDLCTEEVRTGSFVWEPENKNEGFKTSGQVQHVAMAGNFADAGYEYNGAFCILRVILNYDYLWTNIRVLGGAYGCMSSFAWTGDSFMASYRDPHLARTLDVFRGLPEYLRNFTADERTMTKYIIGAIGTLDAPMSASRKGLFSLKSFLIGRPLEAYQRERDQILDAQAEDIAALADAVEAVIRADEICVIGSEAVLEKDAACLKTVRALN